MKIYYNEINPLRVWPLTWLINLFKTEITQSPALGTVRLIVRKMLYVKCIGLCLRSLHVDLHTSFLHNVSNPDGRFCNSTGWRLQPMRWLLTLVSPPLMSSRHHNFDCNSFSWGKQEGGRQRCMYQILMGAFETNRLEASSNAWIARVCKPSTHVLTPP